MGVKKQDRIYVHAHTCVSSGSPPEKSPEFGEAAHWSSDSSVFRGLGTNPRVELWEEKMLPNGADANAHPRDSRADRASQCWGQIPAQPLTKLNDLP